MRNGMGISKMDSTNWRLKSRGKVDLGERVDVFPLEPVAAAPYIQILYDCRNLFGMAKLFPLDSSLNSI